MKMTIVATIFALIATPCLASALTMECTAKSLKVRQGPEEGSPMIGGIMNGEKVTFIEKSGRWTKIQFKKGKEGYVFSSYLRAVDDPKIESKEDPAPKSETNAAPEPSKEATSKDSAPLEEERSLLDPQTVAPPKFVKPIDAAVPKVVAESAKTATPTKTVEPAKSPEIPKMKTIVLTADRENEEAIATLKSTNDALVKELAAMRQERAEMAALKKEIAENMRCVVKEREENERRAKHAEEMQKKAETEIADIKSTLVLGGHSRLITLADNGEKAYFKGVGEVNLAFEGGRTVLRVVEGSSAKAEKALASSTPEKYLRNGFAYFIVDSKSLASF